MLLEKFKTFKALNSFFFRFSKALPGGEYVNLAYSNVWLWLEGYISSPVRYSYLSFSPDDNANIFAASLLILN